MPQLGLHDRFEAFRVSVNRAIYNSIQFFTDHSFDLYHTPPSSLPGLPGIVDRQNYLARKALTENYDYLWIVQGDVEVPLHAFGNLLNLDVDVAFGVVRRHTEDDFIAGFVGSNKKVWYMPQGLISNHVLVGPVMAGCSCVLIKRRVLESVKFHFYQMIGEDVNFAYDVARAGFSAAIDGDVVCGHLPEKPLQIDALDVGCGHTPEGSVNIDLHPEPTLHRSFGQVVLADDPINMEKTPNFVLADAEGHIPFKDRSFDHIHSGQVIEHLANPKTLLDECLRVARFTVIINCPDPDGRCATLPLHLQQRRLTPLWFKRILDRNPDVHHVEIIDKEHSYLWVKIFKRNRRDTIHE